MSLLCLLGFHRRSRGRACYEGSSFVSQCRRCGIPMKKDAKGKWIVARGGA